MATETPLVERIRRACDQLEANGTTPSLKTVRAHLGESVSAIKVQEVLNARRGGVVIQAPLAELAPTAPPQGARQQVMDLIESIFGEEQARLKRQFEQEILDLRQQVNNLQQALAEKEAVLVSKEKEVSVIQTQMSDLLEELARLEDHGQDGPDTDLSASAGDTSSGDAPTVNVADQNPTRQRRKSARSTVDGGSEGEGKAAGDTVEKRVKRVRKGYDDGVRIRVLAQREKVSEKTIRAWLKTTGVEFKPRGLVAQRAKREADAGASNATA